MNTQEVHIKQMRIFKPGYWRFPLSAFGMIGLIAAIMAGLPACQTGYVRKIETLTTATVPNGIIVSFAVSEV